MLFSLGVVIVTLNVLERPSGRRALLSSLPLALLLLGIKENNRRLAFVELAMALLAVYLLTPWVRWKRELTRAVLVAAPIVAVYVGLGWNSTSGALFSPVRTLKSVSDGTSNRSTAWREVENWNISMSIRARPLLGLGLGREYTQHMANDDISGAYPEYRQWPHNSVLGLLLLGGLLPFTALWSVFAVGVFLAVRALHRAREPRDRVAALAAVGALIACAVQAYGDLGAAFTQYRVFVPLAAVVAGKLAVATGAWPAPRRARAAEPAATGALSGGIG